MAREDEKEATQKEQEQGRVQAKEKAIERQKIKTDKNKKQDQQK